MKTAHRLVLAATVLAAATSTVTDAQVVVEPTPPATAQAPSVAELVKLKQNPVSGLKQILFEANMDPGYPQSGDTQGIYSLQAVWPFSLGKNYRLVSYTILPVAHLPETPGGGSVTGLSDTLVNLFISPKKAGSFVWGVGPSILLPTRTDADLGTNRVGLGPAALIFFPQKNWSFGLVLQNNWSLGGEGINKVDAFGAQYLFSYNLPHGWSIYSNSTITANWTRDPGQRWTVPVGGGIGKLFVAGTQPISVSLQAFYNVVTPTDGPSWSMNFQLAFLFAAPQ
jgi:hypothetical protein